MEVVIPTSTWHLQKAHLYHQRVYQQQRDNMLLGHGAIGQFGVSEALSGLVVNAGTVELTLGQSVGTSTGSETVTGSASFAVTTAGAPSFSLGTEVSNRWSKCNHQQQQDL